jgi:hypothetical protein
MGNKGETSPCTLVRNCPLLRYDFNSGKNYGTHFFFFKFYKTVVDARPYQRLGLHPRTPTYCIPYYLMPGGRSELYGGTARLWSGFDEIQTGGGVSSRWSRNQDQSCGGAVFLVFLQ